MCRTIYILFILQLHRITCNEHVRRITVASPSVASNRRFWQRGLVSTIRGICAIVSRFERERERRLAQLPFACTSLWIVRSTHERLRFTCCSANGFPPLSPLPPLPPLGVVALIKLRTRSNEAAEMRNSARMTRAGVEEFRRIANTRQNMCICILFVFSRFNCTVTAIEHSSPFRSSFFFFYVRHIAREACNDALLTLEGT